MYTHLPLIRRLQYLQTTAWLAILSYFIGMTDGGNDSFVQCALIAVIGFYYLVECMPDFTQWCVLKWEKRHKNKNNFC